jgi:pyrroloquinoline quinone biosynthesis protein E
VVWGGNAQLLPDIATRVREHGFYVHNFILFNAYHGWNDAAKVAGMQARYAEVAGPLTEAVSALDAAGLAVNVRYAPYCVLPGLERHLVGWTGSPTIPSSGATGRAATTSRPPIAPSPCPAARPTAAAGGRRRGRTACGSSPAAGTT